MHEYDTVLKALLQGPANSVLQQISGSIVARWLPIELPRVENLRMDLLGETVTGELIHIELQSTNEAQMPLRMAEYLLRALRLHGRFARQIVLYVGEPALSMSHELKGMRCSFAYELVDIRHLDAEQLLASASLSDNIIAILGKLNDRREALRRVLNRIAKLGGEERATRFQQLSILAGLRRLGEDIKEEAKHMPILNDIMDHDIIGPAIQQGIQEGMQRGIQEGMQQGMQQGSLETLRKVTALLIQKRFGKMPTRLEEKLLSLTAPELEAMALRITDAQSPNELL